MRLVLISDTHQLHRVMPRIPDGDVLIHAGDITGHGSMSATRDFNEWLGELPHRHKLVIAGNHDFHFQNHPDEARALITNATYLQDSGVEIDGVKFWGSPWSAEYRNWAFMGNFFKLRAMWRLIPDDTNVLITHGPPHTVMDKAARTLQDVGCPALLARLYELKQLKLHVFGHIHEGYGHKPLPGWTGPDWSPMCVNASTCSLSYQAVNPPVVVELDETCAWVIGHD